MDDVQTLRGSWYDYILLWHDMNRRDSYSESYPTAYFLISTFYPTGVPPGVVNIVFGTGPKAGDALVAHPDVPLISFTGSTGTAQRITERSAPYCKKLSLELGGKNPAIIFADADLERCIETTVRSSFLNQVSCIKSISDDTFVYKIFCICFQYVNIF